jgi:hypothetical protein
MERVRMRYDHATGRHRLLRPIKDTLQQMVALKENVVLGHSR